MGNKVYVVYTDDGKRVGFMIVSDGKTSMYINEGNPKQATIDAIADYRDVLKNTETYDRIFLSDALKQQQEEAKQKRELEEKIAEAKKATEENKEKSVTDNRTEEDKLDERAAKYGIANLKPSNTLKKWVATGAIALIEYRKYKRTKSSTRNIYKTRNRYCK